MGPLKRDEWITLLVFAGVGLTWLTTVFHGLDVTLVAFIGFGVLLVTGTMSWQTAASERSAWDVFVWYGGMLRMGQLLNDTGSTRVVEVSGVLVKDKHEGHEGPEDSFLEIPEPLSGTAI